MATKSKLKVTGLTAEAATLVTECVPKNCSTTIPRPHLKQPLINEQGTIVGFANVDLHHVHERVQLVNGTYDSTKDDSIKQPEFLDPTTRISDASAYANMLASAGKGVTSSGSTLDALDIAQSIIDNN